MLYRSKYPSENGETLFYLLSPSSAIKKHEVLYTTTAPLVVNLQTLSSGAHSLACIFLLMDVMVKPVSLQNWARHLTTLL